MEPNAASLVCVWLLGLAALALPLLFGASSYAAHVSEIVAMVWVMGCGLAVRMRARGNGDGDGDAHADRASGRGGGRSLESGGARRSRAIDALWIALPQWGAAAAADVSAGRSARAVALTFGAAAVWMVILAASAERAAAAGSSGARAHAIAWTIVVPGLFVWSRAVEWGGNSATGVPHAWIARMVELSPIEWLARRVPLEASAETGVPWLASTGVVLVWSSAVVWAARSRARGATARERTA